MLSIIVPSYNRKELLERALVSVFAQRFDHEFECIVIDDGSTDGTEQMVKSKFPSAIYHCQRNQGVSAARNAGLAYARGDWIALLDSDDEWLENKLSRQFELLEDSGLLVCHTEEIWIRNGVRVNQMNKHKKSGGRIYMNCLPLCAMSPSSIVIHRDVFQQMGNFDASLPACEDYDLWLRIASKYEVAYVEEACIRKYGGHTDQLSRQYWGMDRFRVVALEKILSGYITNLTKLEQQTTLHLLLKKLTILSKGAVKHGNKRLSEECELKLEYWQNIQLS